MTSLKEFYETHYIKPLALNDVDAFFKHTQRYPTKWVDEKECSRFNDDNDGVVVVGRHPQALPSYYSMCVAHGNFRIQIVSGGWNPVHTNLMCPWCYRNLRQRTQNTLQELFCQKHHHQLARRYEEQLRRGGDAHAADVRLVVTPRNATGVDGKQVLVLRSLIFRNWERPIWIQYNDAATKKKYINIFDQLKQSCQAQLRALRRNVVAVDEEDVADQKPRAPKRQRQRRSKKQQMASSPVEVVGGFKTIRLSDQ